MAEASTPMMQWSLDDGVAVIEILASDIQGPEAAAVLGARLDPIHDDRPSALDAFASRPS